MRNFLIRHALPIELVGGLMDTGAVRRAADYGVRTRASVADGVKSDTGWDKNQTRIVAYEPGNGTRYLMLFHLVETTVEQNLERHFSLPSHFAMVSWIIEGKSMLLVLNDNFLHWSYVAEKLRCSVPTAVVLAELFAFVLPGRIAMTTEEWLESQQE